MKTTGCRTPHHTTSRVVAQTLETYDRDARIFLARWGKPRYRQPALLAECLRLMPARSVVLDLGCGGGQDARHLGTVGHRVIGLDRARPLLQFAKQRTPSLPFILADIRALPIVAGSLDGIWAAASLVHLPKAAATEVLSKLRHCLRPGGVLAGTVTYGTKSRILKRGWMPGRYFARWTKPEFRRALRGAGWDIIALRVVSNQERKGRWINMILRPT
jgi:SAM-dependent methyltransferase